MTDDNTKAALAASLVGGYLLGRSGKGKLALAVAAYVTSKKLQAKPQELLAAGAGRVGSSPQLSQLSEQVRTELLSVGREAVKAAVDRRLGSFADSLADRTKALGDLPDAEEEEEPRPEEEEPEEPEEGPEQPKRSANGQKSTRADDGSESRKPAEKSAQKASEKPREKTSGKKAPAKAPAEKSASAKKTQQSPGKKKSEKSSSTESRRRR